MQEIGAEDGAYYVSKAVSCIYGTYGGIAVDDHGHVLNENDEMISGLYACGEVTGSHDFQVNHAYAGGLGPALVMGSVTAETAAADLK